MLASPTAGAAAIRGGALRVTGYFLGVLLSVLSAAVLFRYLGPDDAGKYVTVLAIVAIVGSMFDGGLHSLAIREASVRRGPDRSAVIDDLLGMRMAMGAVAILLAERACSHPWVRAFARARFGARQPRPGLVEHAPDPRSAARLGAAPGLGDGDRPVPKRRRRRAHASRSRWPVSASIAFLAVPIPVAAVAVVWTAVLVRTQISLRPSFRLDAWRVLLRDVVPYALATAAGLLYFRVAVVLLSLIASPHETGLYSAAFRTVEVLLIVPQLAVSTVLPIFAHAASKDRDRLAYGVDRTFRTAAVFGGGLAVVLALGAPFAIAVVAGPDFSGAANMLRIQAVGLGIALVTAVFTYALLSLRMHRELLYANLAALAVSVVLTLALGSAWGGVGAATATAIAELCLAGSAVWLLRARSPRAAPAVVVPVPHPHRRARGGCAGCDPRPERGARRCRGSRLHRACIRPARGPGGAPRRARARPSASKRSLVALERRSSGRGAS